MLDHIVLYPYWLGLVEPFLLKQHFIQSSCTHKNVWFVCYCIFIQQTTLDKLHNILTVQREFPLFSLGVHRSTWVSIVQRGPQLFSVTFRYASWVFSVQRESILFIVSLHCSARVSIVQLSLHCSIQPMVVSKTTNPPLVAFCFSTIQALHK